jgi:predicted acylesterase/phospholipase RssA
MKTVALALQGGGAHGAFVWGVLDRLCQERQLKISAISGASSGAFNAAVYLYGLASGGAKGAREALEDFWINVAKQALWSGNPFIGASFFGAFRNIDNHPLSIWIGAARADHITVQLALSHQPGRICSPGGSEGSGETKAFRAVGLL